MKTRLDSLRLLATTASRLNLLAIYDKRNICDGASGAPVQPMHSVARQVKPGSLAHGPSVGDNGLEDIPVGREGLAGAPGVEDGHGSACGDRRHAVEDLW